jgi:prepilin-type N-terminal cleavage/methylation domain-containing protein
MRTHDIRGGRRGFTLVEMMVAVTLILLVFAAAVPFFRIQAEAVSAHAGRSDAQQTARFAFTSIDRDVRVAGAGIADQQPLLVQADPYAITFNADLVTTAPGDRGAVYYDPSASLRGTTVLPRARRVTLPRSTTGYPDSTYMLQALGQTGLPLPSRAETVSYWVSPDSSTARGDDHVMFRRVNDLEPTVVAKGIVLPPGQPIFRYFQLDSAGVMREIAQTRLPLFHAAAVHGSQADSARSALTDSVRAVRVRISSTYRDARGDSATRTVEGSIRLLNTGLVRFSSCGEPPIGAPLAARVAAMGGSPVVNLSWPPSVDDAGGERDLDRYALFRRGAASPDWGEPFASVPAGQASYAYTDTDVRAGQHWVYALVAQDCSPASSSMSIADPGPIP